MVIQTSPRILQSSLVRFAGLIVVLLIGLSACEKKPAPEPETTTEPTPVIDKTHVNTAADQLWMAGEDILAASVAGANALSSAIDLFLASPSADSITFAQQKWQEAFLDYRRFYFFHFLGQAAPSHFNVLAESHYRIAAHPIQPGYLDSFGPYLYSGLVHDISMPISRENLINQHGLTNSEDAALGLYAIHFMLFGIDGNRAPADYSTVKELSPKDIEAGFKKVEETPNHRRRLLLQMQANILLDDLTALHNGWQSNQQNPLYQNWQAFAPREKWNLVRQTLKQGLTQLIVDVVALNKLKEAAATEARPSAETAHAESTETGEADTEKTDTEEIVTEEIDFSYSNYPASNQQQFVLLSIESLLEAVPVLREEKREEIESLLLETSAMLAEPFDGKQENGWTNVYENLKAAADALSDPSVLGG